MVFEVEALLAKDTRGHFVRGKIPRRDVTANDILIDIHYAGICHSDVHQAKGEWPMPAVYPMVPGHEIAGVVEAVGDKVTKYKVGDKVGVGCFVDSCRSCNMCKLNEEQYCSNPGYVGTYNAQQKDEKLYPEGKTFGGYSQKIVVDVNYVLAIPDSLPFEYSAPLLCAGITMFSPLNHYGAKAAGKDFHVGIIGLGGLGDMGVKIALAMKNKVSVVSRSERKREYVEKTLGVDYICSGSTSESLTSMSQKYADSFDLVICTIAADFNMGPYLSLVKTDGTFCMVGVPANPLSFHAFDVIGKRKKIGGSLIGGIKETQEMLEFCAEHQLWSEAEVIHAKEVNRAYVELATNAASKQRFVIDVQKTLVEGDWKVQSDMLKKAPSHKVHEGIPIIGAENTSGKTYLPAEDLFE